MSKIGRRLEQPIGYALHIMGFVVEMKAELILEPSCQYCIIGLVFMALHRKV